jgi:hypothetical protein
MPIDQRHLPDVKLAIVNALHINGSLLGRSYSPTTIARSFRPLKAVPPSLYPSPLQLAVQHHCWIDGWPFPRMRDNMILLQDMLDVKEFFEDLCAMNSFMICDGSWTWDTAGWRISREFAEKWGYLFH